MGVLTESYWPADTSEPVLELTTGDLLREAARDAPDQTALIEVAPPGTPSLTGADRTGRAWTYRQLLAEAEQCAHWLLTRFEPGERITVWAPNVPEWVILQYGAALAGMVVVTANPALRAPELRYVLEQSRSAGLFHVDAFRGSDMTAIAREATPELPELRETFSFGDWQTTVRAHQEPGPLPRVRPGDAAQIQYTSGTTGFPKGALLHHRGLVANARFMIDRTQLPARGTMVSPMPMFHTAGCAMGVLGCAHQRATYVLCQLFDPALVLAATAEHRADMLAGVPTMLIAMLSHPAFGQTDLSRLSIVLSGGSPVPPELVRRVEDRFGVRFTAVYGQTELSPVVTQTSPDDSPEDKAGTAGRPLPQVEVSVRDPLTGEPAPIGRPGEICARGYQAMLGYFEMPERTAETIDTEGWVHTGDLGVFDDRGYLQVTGRLKDMIIRGGENIYATEIEQVLFTHPAVRDVAVLGVPDPAWGEIVAVVLVPAEPASLPAIEELRELCRAHLAPHKTPSRWFQAGELPLTGSGKIQKFRLREEIDHARLRELPAG
ncbi:AMP-binding protein [Amycolatopsis alkalitolerans]|uniref:AMP-binding protein n=1 Tax=Amycolatopsis alkalitolerans TaxID=2547244 RepID=A0A5C4M1E2_9PSEU|nr:AMP-binding protein [Amycolatopsis alkalitolerans]TNC25747.1 AMP-binding protein [Amycolatopsis alkalitolerans]